MTPLALNELKCFRICICWAIFEFGYTFLILFLFETLKMKTEILIYFKGVVQDCSKSIANALELLQSCTKPSKNVLDSIPAQQWP